jgi:hypothetical protein
MACPSDYIIHTFTLLILLLSLRQSRETFKDTTIEEMLQLNVLTYTDAIRLNIVSI